LPKLCIRRWVPELVASYIESNEAISAMPFIVSCFGYGSSALRPCLRGRKSRGLRLDAGWPPKRTASGLIPGSGYAQKAAARGSSCAQIAKRYVFRFSPQRDWLTLVRSGSDGMTSQIVGKLLGHTTGRPTQRSVLFLSTCASRGN